ncbi:MAG: hypothetical protein ACRCWJ_11605 [Casimicrobium sp.]
MTEEEIKLNDRARRGEQAAELLKNPLFASAVEGLKAAAIARLQSCDTNDGKRLQTLTLMLQTVDAFDRYFRLWVEDGQIAVEERLDMKNQPPEIGNRFSRVE